MRDEIVVGVFVASPLRSVTIDDLPNLKNVIGGGADPATVASRNVILHGSASVVDADVITSLLLVWIGDASMVDDKLTWPVRIFRSSNDTEYSRPAPGLDRDDAPRHRQYRERMSLSGGSDPPARTLGR